MNLPTQLAQHFRAVHYGGNWTDVNLKATLADVTWQQATTQLGTVNTIARLVFHLNYYVSGVLPVFRGGTLDIKDKYSFDLPPILSAEDWKKLLDKTWADADDLANLIEQLPEEQLWEAFTDAKYGNYYRNICGMIEHHHYHLGQIVVVKKMLPPIDEN